MADATPRVTYDYVTAPSRGRWAIRGGDTSAARRAGALLAVGHRHPAVLLRYGLGLAGYSHPVYWAVFITCFVFWWASRTRDADLRDPVLFPLGVAHGGVPHRRGDDRFAG